MLFVFAGASPCPTNALFRDDVGIVPYVTFSDIPVLLYSGIEKWAPTEGRPYIPASTDTVMFCHEGACYAPLQRI